MATLSDERIGELLAPYLPRPQITDTLVSQLSAYLDLLLRWNARTNLTAVRAPEQIVQRQMGESLFAARFIAAGSTVLDFGSGAGFPGIPLCLLRPDLHITLAESQGKKVAFLREAVRLLGVKCEVWPQRVEAMPAFRRFDTVVMRAVDDSGSMLPVAAERIALEGALLLYEGHATEQAIKGMELQAAYPMPLSSGRVGLYRSSAVLILDV